MLNENIKPIGWLFLILVCSVIILGAICCNRITFGGEAIDVNVTIDYSTEIAQSPVEYGTQTWWIDQNSSNVVSGWKELGVNTVRVGLSQDFLEPTNDDDNPNHINWDGFKFDDAIPWPAPEKTITMRDWYEAIRDAGLTVMIVPFYTTGWNSYIDRGPYSPYPPMSLAEHKEFTYAFLYWLVNEVNFPPDKIIFEAMNEPDEIGLAFWENWDMDDIENVCRVSREAADAVDPSIRVIGPCECRGVDIAEDLMDNYNGAKYLDGLSYHYYGVNFNTAFSRANSLKAYGLPVYLTEYGNFKYYSEGTKGALWHSKTLPLLWKDGDIRPIQYVMTNFPTGLDEARIRKLALQLDWHDDWQKKPSWWIHANFWHYLGGTEIIASTATGDLEVISGKRVNQSGKYEVIVWVTNTGTTAYNPVNFQVLNFPASDAIVRVYDNLQGNACMDSYALSGMPLNFTYTIPARSSYCFVLKSENIFDTGPGTCPSIIGTHNGKIKPLQNITVNKMYTYPCAGTGGHTEYARIWNNSLNVIARWDGYKEDGHNITFNETFVLYKDRIYNYTIRTGSYPQIHHIDVLEAEGGIINCTLFVDANGKKYNNGIPAIRLWA